MTILIILVALIAVAYIFGKDVAKKIVWGSGATGLLLIVLVVIGIFVSVYWEQFQKTFGIVAFIFIFALIRIGWGYVVDKGEKRGQREQEILKYLTDKELNSLSETARTSGWDSHKHGVIDQAHFFASILEGGIDPRNLTPEENFSFINPSVYEKAKRELLDGSNLTPVILQYIRKRISNAEISMPFIREQLGVVSVIGNQTAQRIENILVETIVEKKEANEISESIVKKLANTL